MAVLHGLIQRKVDNRMFIEFPKVKGRILEKVEFFTQPDFHSLPQELARDSQCYREVVTQVIRGVSLCAPV